MVRKAALALSLVALSGLAACQGEAETPSPRQSPPAVAIKVGRLEQGRSYTFIPVQIRNDTAAALPYVRVTCDLTSKAGDLLGVGVTAFGQVEPSATASAEISVNAKAADIAQTNCRAE